MAMQHGAVISEERSQVTSASAETVWRVWSDSTTWPQWNLDVRKFELNGFFDNGVKGTMTTSAGTQRVALIDVVQEETFTLVARQTPLITCYYRCTIRPWADGQTKISESINVRGLLSAVTGTKVRERIAQGLAPTLKALAAKAESIERRQSPRSAWYAEEYAEIAEQRANA